MTSSDNNNKEEGEEGGEDILVSRHHWGGRPICLLQEQEEEGMRDSYGHYHHIFFSYFCPSLGEGGDEPSEIGRREGLSICP